MNNRTAPDDQPEQEGCRQQAPAGENHPQRAPIPKMNWRYLVAGRVRRRRALALCRFNRGGAIGLSELESCLITRVKPGMKCGRLPDFGFEEPEHTVVRGLKPVNRD